ncbi:MAG: hypothetical protein KF810_22960 [Rhizobiaceae bacterium]|nr:hypothetical protein [Rhizobiaceae bacterium]
MNDGLRLILVSGDFGYSDDVGRLKSMVANHGATAVTFNSPGGNISKALEVGRLIRSLGLNTIQVRGLECASACAFAFMGGVLRVAEPGSIGVHQSWYADDGLSAKDAVSDVQRTSAEIMAYMREMGVDPSLVELSFRYEANDMRYLSGSEMAEYRVTSNSPEPKPTLVQDAPIAPNRSTVPEPPVVPKFHPVSTADRKVAIADIPGDSRPVVWVYINSCGGQSSPVAENLRTRLLDSIKSDVLRLAVGKVAYFGPDTPNCRLASHSLMDFTQQRASRAVADVAKTELMSVLYNYNFSPFQGLPNAQDDEYRFDVWLKPSKIDARPVIADDSIPGTIPPATWPAVVIDPNQFVVADGFDAIGNDLPQMPLQRISAGQCQQACSIRPNCLAATYNTKYRACFLKGDAKFLVAEQDAIAFVREGARGRLRKSNLVFQADAEVIGKEHSKRKDSYPNCIIACAADAACQGFNFKRKDQTCTLMTIVFRTTANSGIASARRIGLDNAPLEMLPTKKKTVQVPNDGFLEMLFGAE